MGNTMKSQTGNKLTDEEIKELTYIGFTDEELKELLDYPIKSCHTKNNTRQSNK